jgi:protein-S-isoprenylcysteine O-methyltransferase Ste14
MNTSIYSILWLGFAVVWLVAWVRTKRTQESVPLSYRLRYGLPVLIGSCLMLTDDASFAMVHWHRVPKNPIVSTVAVTLTIVGIAFAIWARFYLGRNWSSVVTIKVDHELIRTGPYRWVRHPIYFGLLVALFGTALAKGTPPAFVAVFLFFLGFSIKSRMEEQFMLKTFGAEYEEYSRSTGRLIPKLRF